MATSKGHRPAGGPRSRNVTEKPVRYGQPAQGKRHQAVSQIGQNLGDHVTESGKIHRGAVERVEGPRPISVRLGNEMTKPCGPQGQGRTLYGSGGTQQQYGSAAPGNPPAKNVDILGSFGPESKPR
jgi:hypothetical protein